jgi:serine/threonine-protein kinase
MESAPTTVLIKVAPWAQVFLDGHLLGVTPLAPARVTPGEHSVVLVNARLGVRKKVSVLVRPNQSSVFKFDLRELRHSP